MITLTHRGVTAELRKIQPTGESGMHSRHYTPHAWDGTEAPSDAFTAWEVLVNGELIGVVSKHKSETYRKVGRLIARTFHPTHWEARPAGWRRIRSIRDQTIGYHYYSRQDAAEALLRHWSEQR